MNTMRTCFLILSAIYVRCSFGGDVDKGYYWREYTGIIPEDAVEAGYDINRNSTYVGQTFISGQYLQVVRIYPGKRIVVASYEGIVHRTSVYVKILCSRFKKQFYWKAINGSKSNSSTIGESAVIGGFENGNRLGVGRLNYQGELIVGKVCIYNSGKSSVYFPYGNEEKRSELYQLLNFDSL